MLYTVAMYIESVPNRKSPPAILLRESAREKGKVVKRTLANLSHWPKSKIEALRAVLRDQPLLPPEQLFEIERSRPHGHVQMVLGIMRQLGLDEMLFSKRCRERDLILAMVAQRVLFPASKLANTRLWHTTTLAEELSVQDANENELYAALDWLLERQPEIERKLAARHLHEGALVLYDISSSYYYGHTCPLALHGHNRDGDNGLPIIVYGVLADEEGRPLAVDVYPGNTGDPSTVPDQAEKVRQSFGLERIVLAGDRGMLTQTQIVTLKQYPGLGWISALRSTAIRQLVAAGAVQRSLFDECNLAEISSADFPGERLIACYNPLLADERQRTRSELLAATEKELEKIVRAVRGRTKTPLSASEIGVKVGKSINRFKMAKHFETRIADGSFSYSRKPETIAQETQLDGLYVLRTSEPAARLPAADVVRGYKSLAQVERVFRCVKGLDIMVQPIFLRTEDHVRAHIFLCVLACYVEWRLREALAPLLFADDQVVSERKTRDPVAPATPSVVALRKRATHTTPEGFEVQSFRTLLQIMATRCRNTCRVKSARDSIFVQVTKPDALQAHILKLLKL
jgi:transposase